MGIAMEASIRPSIAARLIRSNREEDGDAALVAYRVRKWELWLIGGWFSS